MKIITNSIMYSCVTFFQRAVGFLLLPVYTHCLTTKDYGIVNVVNSAVGMYSIFYLFSFNGAGTWLYCVHKKDEEKVKRIWGTLINFVLINMFVLSLILIVARKWLLAPFVENIPFMPYIIFGIISTATNTPYALFQAELQARQEGTKFAINNFIYFLINISLTLYFVLVEKTGAKGILLATAITNIIAAVYTMVFYVPKFGIIFDVGYFKQAVKYSLPLIPHAMAAYAMVYLDKIFLNNIQSTDAVGIYSIGFQLASIMGIITSSVNQAYTPWFLDKINAIQHNRNDIIKLSNMLIKTYCLIGLFMSIFSPEVLNLMTSKAFRNSWIVVPFLTFSSVLMGIYFCVVNSLFADRTKYVPIVTALGAVFSIGLNLLLIPRMSLIGSSLASMLSSAICAIIALIIAEKVFPIGFNWISMFSNVLLYLALTIGVLFFGKYIPITTIILKIIVVIIAFYIFYTMSKKEINEFIMLMSPKIKLSKAQS